MLLVLRVLDDELAMYKTIQACGPVKHRSSLLRYRGVPESAKRILHCEWPLKSLASADQGLMSLC